MGICHFAILNKGIEYGCTLLIVSGNVPALLGMPDCEWIKIVTLNCQTADDQHKMNKLMNK